MLFVKTLRIRCSSLSIWSLNCLVPCAHSLTAMILGWGAKKIQKCLARESFFLRLGQAFAKWVMVKCKLRCCQRTTFFGRGRRRWREFKLPIWGLEKGKDSSSLAISDTALTPVETGSGRGGWRAHSGHLEDVSPLRNLHAMAFPDLVSEIFL